MSNLPRRRTFARLFGLPFLFAGAAEAQTLPSPKFGAVTGDASGMVVTPTGGSTARSLAARFADTLTLRDYILPVDADSTNGFMRALAVAAASPFGTLIELPPGRVYLSAALAVTLVGNTALTIRGAGSTQSELVWTADTNGLSVTLSSDSGWTRDTGSGKSCATFTIEGVGLVRAFGSEGKTALSVSGTSTLNRGSRQFFATDIWIRGGAGAGAWLNGIAAYQIAGTILTDIDFHCPETAAGTGTAISVTTSSTFVMTLVRLTRIEVYNCNVGLYIGANVQGVSITDSAFVSVQYGVQGGVLGGINGDSLGITNTHFDYRISAIQMANYQSISIIGCYFLGNASGVSNTAIAIDLQESWRNVITGNCYFGNPSTTAQSVLRVNNAAGGSGQQCPVSFVGNSVTTLTGPMVILANGTNRASIMGNVISTQSAGGIIGTDAFGTSTFAGNTVNGVTGVVDLSTLGAASMTVTATGNANGASLKLLGNGAATPAKTLRAQSGVFQIINDAFTATILSLTDAGELDVPDVNLAGTGPMAGAWTSVASTITPSSGSLTTATATVRYKKFGRTVFVDVVGTVTTNGTGAGNIAITLPFPSASYAALGGREAVTTGKGLAAILTPGGGAAYVTNYDGTYPGVNGAILALSGCYEATT